MDNAVIIDDEVDICFLLSNILNKKGYTSQCAHNLLKGTGLVEDLKPSILFLDINLPDGNGLDAIKQFRSKLPGLHIVIISAYDTERDHAMQRGADAFISKPFNKEEIFTVLNHSPLQLVFKSKSI